MFEDDHESESGSTSTSTNSSGSSTAPPHTPAVRRREKGSPNGGLKSYSNPILTIPPRIALATRGGSAAGNLGGDKKDGKESSCSGLGEDSSMSTSSRSIKISSPLDAPSDEILDDQPSSGFMPPLGFGFGDQVTFAPSHAQGPTPPPHLLQQTAWKQSSSPAEPTLRDSVPNYSPHPNSIAMTTRDLPPKGWYVITEAGIVLGSAAAYHGSSVRKVSTRAMTLVVSTLNEARNVATQNMLKAASHRGCNAILGLKYDTSSPVPEISLVTAYGTACVIAREDGR